MQLAQPGVVGVVNVEVVTLVAPSSAVPRRTVKWVEEEGNTKGKGSIYEIANFANKECSGPI